MPTIDFSILCKLIWTEILKYHFIDCKKSVMTQNLFTYSSKVKISIYIMIHWKNFDPKLNSFNNLIDRFFLKLVFSKYFSIFLKILLYLKFFTVFLKSFWKLIVNFLKFIHARNLVKMGIRTSRTGKLVLGTTPIRKIRARPNGSQGKYFNF